MIRSKNPRIDVEQLQARVRETMDRSADARENVRISKMALDVHLQAIEDALKHAEERSVPRTAWPDNLNLFPFSLSPGLRRLALRMLGFALRDQQEVNAALIRSQHELLALVRALMLDARADDE